MVLTHPVASVVGAAFFAAALAMPALAASETKWQRLLDGAKEPQNWLTHHRSLDAQRYSPLSQINRNNVEGLNVAWIFELGARDVVEVAARLAVHGVEFEGFCRAQTS